jgi:hypothetical protein
MSVDHSNITAHGGAAIYGWSVYVTNSLITSDQDGITPVNLGGSRQSVIQGNVIFRDGTTIRGYHHDGIQLWQGGNVLVEGNYVHGWATSAIMLKSDHGPIRNITVTGNWLANETGYVVIYVMNGGHGRPQMVTITDNVIRAGKIPIFTAPPGSPGAVFVKTEQERTAAIRAGDASAAEWIVWNHNVDASGKPIDPPGGYHTAR